MATRAMSTRKPSHADWRIGLRRSLRRAGQMTGAGLLLFAMIFLALALASYTQTDPSPSTAAAPGEVRNWMGGWGAWAADRILFLFGLPGLLVLPLFYVSARRLWRAVELDENEDGTPPTRWWLPTGLLLIAIVLFGTVLSLAFEGGSATLPAQWGGVSGLLGASGIEAIAGRFGESLSGWIVLGAALGCLAVATGLVTRIFAIDWRALLTLPNFLHDGLLARLPFGARDGGRIDYGEGDADAEATPRLRRKARAEARPEPPVEPAPRRSPEISDPSAPPKRAEPAPKNQRDMFAAFELPSLELLAEPPADSAPKLDKLALERNARLLENVLDDFNVKGEITAVRTGPVVTMYELEPAPGIKASRVVGLAEDIARNMSAISARVSPIPGKTVMGIELPNKDRQVVLLRELAASADFAEAKGNLPIILGKDIAGEPIIADLAAMPHLLVAGTTGSGKSVGLNCILLSLLYHFTPAECRLILIDPKVLELKSYDDIPHLLSPVVTEPHKSVRALKWAVEEMERRYRMMSSVNSRNINSFNEKVRAAAAKGKPLGRRVQTGFDPDTGEQLYEEEQLDYEPLPQIVLIVDELADLMVTVGKEIEVLIQRLSQKSATASTSSSDTNGPWTRTVAPVLGL